MTVRQIDTFKKLYAVVSTTARCLKLRFTSWPTQLRNHYRLFVM